MADGIRKRCPHCRARGQVHKPGCWRACPECKHGVLARAESSADPFRPNFRLFTCGHRIEDPIAQAARVERAIEDDMPSDQILKLLRENPSRLTRP